MANKVIVIWDRLNDKLSYLSPKQGNNHVTQSIYSLSGFNKLKAKEIS